MKGSVNSKEQPSENKRSDHAVKNAKPDFAKRRADLWGDRVFSFEEIESMRLNELEGVERESFPYASDSLLGRSYGNKGPDCCNEGEML